MFTCLNKCGSKCLKLCFGFLSGLQDEFLIPSWINFGWPATLWKDPPFPPLWIMTLTALESQRQIALLPYLNWLMSVILFLLNVFIWASLFPFCDLFACFICRLVPLRWFLHCIIIVILILAEVTQFFFLFGSLGILASTIYLQILTSDNIIGYVKVFSLD